YPNPTTGTVHVNLKNSGSSIATINVLDMQGKTVLTQLSNGNPEIILTLENLNSGIYIAVITIDSKVIKQKIIVQN
ncbi:MAG: T9SS type A sorting domain-containing protein, partial [Bacteroidota bacterium]